VLYGVEVTLGGMGEINIVVYKQALVFVVVSVEPFTKVEFDVSHIKIEVQVSKVVVFFVVFFFFVLLVVYTGIFVVVIVIVVFSVFYTGTGRTGRRWNVLEVYVKVVDGRASRPLGRGRNKWIGGVGVRNLGHVMFETESFGLWLAERVSAM
jgi:hypothetical protein